VKNDLPVGGVTSVAVGIPIGGVAMDFDISSVGTAIRSRERGAKKIGSRPMIPKAGVMEGDEFAMQSGQGVLEQGFEPDSLEDGFG
jgi:hypothetical protein